MAADGSVDASPWGQKEGLQKVRDERAPTPPPPAPSTLQVLGEDTPVAATTVPEVKKPINTTRFHHTTKLDSWGDDDSDLPSQLPPFQFENHSVNDWEETDWA